MALTITEANAVNNLLEWVLGRQGATSDAAAAAAELLADHAHKSLAAGLTSGDVTDHWPAGEAR